MQQPSRLSTVQTANLTNIKLQFLPINSNPIQSKFCLHLLLIETRFLFLFVARFPHLVRVNRSRECPFFIKVGCKYIVRVYIFGNERGRDGRERERMNESKMKQITLSAFEMRCMAMGRQYGHNTQQ